ncbi:MAG TPA: 2-hydroxyacid dehydrogenase [Cytophagales bacterium]|nr:2-hydroxyacid dehydrogenase [Cytophagales bacterium]
MYNCLIIDKMHPSIIPMLESIGVKPDYRPEITREEILNVIENYQGIIVRSKTPINKELFDKAKNLEFIGRAGAGLDQVDLETMQARNITIVNAPEGNRDALAEHMVGMILCLFNNINLGDKQVRNGIWDREGNRGVELKNKTVGIIGYGFMGQAFAKRLTSFECNIIAYDKYKSGFGSEQVKEVALEQIFEEADLLSMHVPLTPETHFMINEDFINRIKKPFYFLNSARGELAKLSVIKKAIETGKISGAVLDVLENEKLNKYTPEQQEAFEFLKSSEKVLFTPHVAGWTHESYVRINEVLTKKIKAYIEGKQ